MKILIVDENQVVGYAGGIEKIICSFANAFDDRAYHVILACLNKEDGKPFFSLNRNVEFINLARKSKKYEEFYNWHWAIKKIEKEILRLFCGAKMELWGRSIKDPKKIYYFNEFIRRLKGCIEEKRPDIILAISPDSTWMAQQAIMGKNIPVISMLHIDPSSAVYHFTPIHIQAWKKAAKVQLLRGLFRQAMQKMGVKDNLVVIPNPVTQVQETKIRDLEHSCRKVIMMGRIEPDMKRQKLGVEAFIKCLAKYPDWSLDIYGNEGNKRYVKDIHALIEQYQVQNKIHLYPPVKDVFSKLSCADIFLFPSKSESFGLAMLEAMSIGVPVIAYKECYPDGDLIQDEFNGLLSDQGVSALASCLERLMEDSKLRIQMGKNAHESVKRFEPQRIWNMWESLIRDVMNNK